MYLPVSPWVLVVVLLLIITVVQVVTKSLLASELSFSLKSGPVLPFIATFPPNRRCSKPLGPCLQPAWRSFASYRLFYPNMKILCPFLLGYFAFYVLFSPKPAVLLPFCIYLQVIWDFFLYLMLPSAPTVGAFCHFCAVLSQCGDVFPPMAGFASDLEMFFLLCPALPQSWGHFTFCKQFYPRYAHAL